MTRRGLDLVKDPAERAELRAVVDSVAEKSFERWLSRRTADDNRVEHEFVVFGAAMRIAEAERLSLSGKLVVICATFLHDTFPIQRITERAIREAEARDRESSDQTCGRRRRVNASSTWKAARAMPISCSANCHPTSGRFVSAEVRDRCAAIIASHDYWKLGRPHPAGSDREALVCFEADALWPLHPLGVLADLERPGEDGEPKDVNDPAEWRRQVHNNLQTLREYRVNWQGTDEVFQDAESIFRTAEGHRLYREWAGLWGL